MIYQVCFEWTLEADILLLLLDLVTFALQGGLTFRRVFQSIYHALDDDGNKG